MHLEIMDESAVILKTVVREDDSFQAWRIFVAGLLLGLLIGLSSCAASIPHRYPALNTSGVSRGDSLWAVDSRDNKWRVCYVDSTWRIRFTGRGYGKLPAGAVK